MRKNDKSSTLGRPMVQKARGSAACGWPPGVRRGLKPLQVGQGSWASHLKPRIPGLGNLGLGNLGPGKT